MPFAAMAFAVTITFFAAMLPPITLGGRTPGNDPLYPAAPGYLLPWKGGQIHELTQGEETAFTHNGTAAYAFDFNLNYDTVVAARSGRVTMVRENSNSGGCNASYTASTNYVVIDHGDGTSGAYLHLAYNSVEVVAGQLVDRGEPIAISGETGLTCGEDDGGPGPHLHFQVQRTEDGRYFTQSLPVAFDDINDGGGVPREGASYASGNYGKGREQKIRLTPYRVPRAYNPVAVATDPTLTEADPNAIHEEPTPSPDTVIEEAPTAVAGAATPQPDETATATRTATKTATSTATPTPTPAPAETPTPEPTAEDTPSPEPTDTVTPATPTGGEPTTTP